MRRNPSVVLHLQVDCQRLRRLGGISCSHNHHDRPRRPSTTSTLVDPLENGAGCQVVSDAIRIRLVLRFSFGAWTLDADRRVLLHGGDPVSLSPKAFDLLRLLVEHHERAFSKAELHQLLWPNTFVSDGSLTILVAEIRHVLQDDADQPRFIRTVRRFGYGFCATVAATDASHPSTEPQNAWVIWGNRSIACCGRADDPGSRARRYHSF